MTDVKSKDIMNIFLGPIHSRINPFYSRNFTFITQEITNTLLKKFESP